MHGTISQSTSFGPTYYSINTKVKKNVSLNIEQSTSESYVKRSKSSGRQNDTYIYVRIWSETFYSQDLSFNLGNFSFLKYVQFLTLIALKETKNVF